MSDISKQMIICPHCKRTSFFKIWNSINTTTHPAARRQVRDLSLFTFCCPYCEKKTVIKYPFLYHQMESSFMICYEPDEEALAETRKMLEESAGGIPGLSDSGPEAGEDPRIRQLMENTLARYRYRIVRTHEELLEKLAIFDAGTDDRIVELVKVILGAQAERQLSGEGFRVKGARFIFEPEPRMLKLVFFDKNSDRTATVSFSQHVADVYNQTVEHYSAALEGPHKKDTVIDWNWAVEFLKNAT